MICERLTGRSYHDLVMERVVGPAGMADSGFFRSDELPSRTALGYLEGFEQRTNVLHLPVRGSGDGGMYTTAADVSAFWAALLGGRIVPEALVAEALRSRTEQTEEGSPYGYGLGCWLTAGAAQLEGSDAGVSFRSRHHIETGTTWTVISNTSDGVWPVFRALEGKTG